MRWIVLGTVLLLAACGNNYKQEPDPPIPGTITYNYALTSATLMPGTSQVIFLTSPTNAGCSIIDGPFTHDFTAVVGVPGTAAFSGPIYRSTYFWTTIYIDNPTADNFLSTGDNVWGTGGPSGVITGYCSKPMGNTTETVSDSWENLGAAHGGGVSVYTGPTQTF